MRNKSEETVKISVRVPKSIYHLFFEKTGSQGYELLKNWICWYAKSDVNPSSLENFWEIVTLQLHELMQQTLLIKELNTTILIWLHQEKKNLKKEN